MNSADLSSKEAVCRNCQRVFLRTRKGQEYCQNPECHEIEAVQERKEDRRMMGRFERIRRKKRNRAGGV